MLIQKSNPIGIDYMIQKAQSSLYSQLISRWGNVNYSSYGRAYRNKKRSGYVAEVYTSSREYHEVYWNDSVDAVSFFGISNNPIVIGVEAKANIHLVYFVNLAKLKPLLSSRGDEEVRSDVLSVIGLSLFGMAVQSVELGLDNVLKEYSGPLKDKLAAVDMHPTHCFRINFTALYNPSQKC